MDFASQLNVSLANGWGIVRTVTDMCMKQPDGKYVLIKDPNKVSSLFSGCSSTSCCRSYHYPRLRFTLVPPLRGVQAILSLAAEADMSEVSQSDVTPRASRSPVV